MSDSSHNLTSLVDNLYKPDGTWFCKWELGKSIELTEKQKAYKMMYKPLPQALNYLSTCWKYHFLHFLHFFLSCAPYWCFHLQRINWLLAIYQCRAYIYIYIYSVDGFFMQVNIQVKAYRFHWLKKVIGIYIGSHTYSQHVQIINDTPFIRSYEYLCLIYKIGL